MSAYDPRRNQRVSRARERQTAREVRRNDAMAVPREEKETLTGEREPVGMTAQSRIDTEALKKRANLVMQDALWYARYRPAVWRWGIGIVLFIVFLFIGSYAFPGRIYPNVYALGVHIGGMTVDEAQVALEKAWDENIRISLMVEGQLMEDVSPSQIGLYADTRLAAENARGVGLAGIPFGYTIVPDVALTYRIAEDFLVARAGQLNFAPKNASYAWQNGLVVGVAGTNGRELDIAGTLTVLNDRSEDVVNRRRWEIKTTSVAPRYPDPEPFLVEARLLAGEQFVLAGYDPFTDLSLTWATPPENLVTWLEVGANGLTVNPQRIEDFRVALNEEIAKTNPVQYISRDDTVAALTASLQAGQRKADIRIRHYPVTYTVQSGDSGYRIARRNGIPYFHIQDANAGRDLTMIYPGDEINLPSKDLVIPLPPVPHKRIVVDLNAQMLYGFENGQEAFNWEISSGMNTPQYPYPTSPGVYQILSHAETALGSSIDLCNNVGNCAQWEMRWFMGMYEVSTGLMNGFHGEVVLPNGAWLMGESVGRPYTYGCIMSRPEQAEFLYHWADNGVVVEVISNEFEPTSELGRQVLAKRNLGGAA